MTEIIAKILIIITEQMGKKHTNFELHVFVRDQGNI